MNSIPMYVLLLAFFFGQTQSLSNLIVPLSESDCITDLSEVCFIESPTSVEDIYYSRLCLWKNQESISSNCMKYVTEVSPSIVEPCFNEIESFCTGIIPGYGQVHNCLSSRAEDITVRCANSLIEDNLRSSERLHDEESSKSSSNIVTMTFSTDTSSFSLSKIQKIYEEIVYSLFYPFSSSSSSSSSDSSSLSSSEPAIVDIFVTRVDDDYGIKTEQILEKTYSDLNLDLYAGDDKEFQEQSYQALSSLSSSSSSSSTAFGFAPWSPFTSMLTDYLASHHDDIDHNDEDKLAVSISDLDKDVADTHALLEFNDDEKHQVDVKSSSSSSLSSTTHYLRRFADETSSKLS